MPHDTPITRLNQCVNADQNGPIHGNVTDVASFGDGPVTDTLGNL